MTAKKWISVLVIPSADCVLTSCYPPLGWLGALVDAALDKTNDKVGLFDSEGQIRCPRSLIKFYSHSFRMAVIASIGLYSMILWMYVMTSLKLSLFIVCVVNGTTDTKQVLNISNNVFWLPGTVNGS